MNKYKPTLAFTLTPIICSCLIHACSSTRVSDDSVHFHTRITDTGLKHFQLSIILQPENQPSRRNAYNNNPSRYSPEERAANKAEKLLKTMTEIKIQETQYCREGYWFLDEKLYSRKVYIRGECNDTATNADRKNFPDTLLYW